MKIRPGKRLRGVQHGKGRVYRRTAAGHKALVEGAMGIASGEYRRILDLLAEEMHFDALRRAMPQYNEAVIMRWLGELERRGLLHSFASGPGRDLDFTGRFNSLRVAAKS